MCVWNELWTEELGWKLPREGYEERGGSRVQERVLGPV